MEWVATWSGTNFIIPLLLSSIRFEYGMTPDSTEALDESETAFPIPTARLCLAQANHGKRQLLYSESNPNQPQGHTPHLSTMLRIAVANTQMV